MSEDRDIRESVTVEYVGNFLGRSIFVEPFKTDEERDLFKKRVDNMLDMLVGRSGRADG